MAYGAVLSDDEWEARIGVKDRTVLDVATGTDLDQFIVAAQDCSEPYAAVPRQTNFPDDLGVRCDPSGLMIN
jgi:hypothetical protein